MRVLSKEHWRNVTTGNFSWKAAIWAGIIAGLVFIMLEMALVALLQGMSPWAPPRMMAAMVMGEGVLPPPADFDAMIMMVAMVIHFALSILLAILFGLGVSRSRLGVTGAIVAGAIFGLAIYFVNFYGFTALFPWFAMARGPISIFAHIVFGAVLGGVYRAIESPAALEHREAERA